MKKLVLFFLAVLFFSLVLGYSQAQTTPIIAAFYTNVPTNPMLAGEVTFFSHSTGSPKKFEWTVVCPDGSIITSQDKILKLNFNLLGEYSVSLTVSRVINGITETDTLAVPGFAKVISDPLKLHPPQSLREN